MWLQFLPPANEVWGKVICLHVYTCLSFCPQGGGGAWSRGGPGGEGSGPGGFLVETLRKATAAGGTHPTGMHSCFSIFVILKCLSKLWSNEVIMVS